MRSGWLVPGALAVCLILLAVLLGLWMILRRCCLGLRHYWSDRPATKRPGRAAASSQANLPCRRSSRQPLGLAASAKLVCGRVPLPRRRLRLCTDGSAVRNRCRSDRPGRRPAPAAVWRHRDDRGTFEGDSSAAVAPPELAFRGLLLRPLVAQSAAWRSVAALLQPALGPLELPGAAVLVSTRDCRLATVRGALVVLDEIARLKRSDAILADASNGRISDRLLGPLGMGTAGRKVARPLVCEAILWPASCLPRSRRCLRVR